MNSDKCHRFTSRDKFKHSRAKKGNNRVWETRTVKLLCITIDAVFPLISAGPQISASL